MSIVSLALNAVVSIIRNADSFVAARRAVRLTGALFKINYSRNIHKVEENCQAFPDRVKIAKFVCVVLAITKNTCKACFTPLIIT